MEELISVIIPVYKVEKYIRRCVESVQKQTYRNLEIILIDDGSPDKSGMICDELALYDNRIKVLHKENGGLSDARNSGIKLAQGEIISFVDSDDYIDSRFFEMLTKQMKVSQSDIVECHFVKFEDGSESKAKYLEYTTLLTPEEWLTESGLGDFISCVVWNKIYRRKVFDGIFFPVGRNHEDEATIYKVVYNSNSITRISSSLYFYRKRYGSITQIKKNIKGVNDQYKALEERAIYFDELNEKKIADFSFAKLAIFMISCFKISERLVGNRNDWYIYIKKIYLRVRKSMVVPQKYKLYIRIFLIFPNIIGK